MAIRNWPIAERPREKLLQQGARQLSDAELLAIFLRTGMRGKTAVDLARELLAEFGGLKMLLNTSSQTLCQRPGVGKAKYAGLIAALELGQRYASEALKVGEILLSSQAAQKYLAYHLQHQQQEVFACLFLNTQHRILAYEELFHGTIDESSVYPREVVKRALAHNAAKVILAHNHPSGDPTPSQADCEITDLLRDSLALVDIRVIDHIIIGQQQCLSLAESGHW
jgi:DNA repair protein RadC